MKKFHSRVVVIVVFAILLLSAFNIYLTIKSRDMTYHNLEKSIAQSQDQTKAYVQMLVSQSLSDISVIQGPQGETGMQGARGAAGQSIQGQSGSNGSNGENGKDGLNGQPGEKGDIGSPGREIELRHDPKTKQLQWRYVGDDLWSTLVNDCEITNTCEVNNEIPYR